MLLGTFHLLPTVLDEFQSEWVAAGKLLYSRHLRRTKRVRVRMSRILGIVNGASGAVVAGRKGAAPQLGTRSQAPLRQNLFQTKGSPERIDNAFRQISWGLRCSPQKDMPVDDRAKKQCQRQVDIETGSQFAILDLQLYQFLQFQARRHHDHAS